MPLVDRVTRTQLLYKCVCVIRQGHKRFFRNVLFLLLYRVSLYLYDYARTEERLSIFNFLPLTVKSTRPRVPTKNVPHDEE